MTRKITKSNQSEQRSDRGAKRSDRGGAHGGGAGLHPYEKMGFEPPPTLIKVRMPRRLTARLRLLLLYWPFRNVIKSGLRDNFYRSYIQTWSPIFLIDMDSSDF